MWTSYVILILSIIWLFTRALKLINLPVDKGIRSLNVFVPKVPILSTDRITQNSIIIHWENKHSTSSSCSKVGDGDEIEHREGGPRLIVNTSPKAVSFYQLYVNGELVTTLESAVNMCKLSNLKPGTRYQLDLIAFSILNFRSRSSPVFVKTIETPYQKIDDADDLLHFLAPKKDAESLKVHSTFRQNRTNIYSGMPISEAKVRDDVDQITDIEELRYLLEAGQEDLRSLLFQQTQCAKDFEEKEVILLSSREDLRKRKKMEDLNRNSVRAELNALEESKKDIVTKIVNNQYLFNEKTKSMQKMKDEIENWKNNLKTSQSRCEELKSSEKKILRELDQKIDDKRDDIKAAKLEIEVLDSELQENIDYKMERESLKAEITSILSSLNRDADSQNGLLKKDGISLLTLLKQIKAEWGNLLETQQSLDAAADSNWRSSEQMELQKLHSIKVQYQSLLSDNQTLQELLAGERNVLTLPRGQTNVGESFPSLESNRPSVSIFPIQMEASNSSFQPAYFEAEDNVEDLSPNVEMLLPQSLIESEELILNNLGSNTVDIRNEVFLDTPSTPVLKDPSYETSSFENTAQAGEKSFNSPFEFNSLHERSPSGDGASFFFQKSPPLSHASLVEPQHLDEQLSTFSPKRLSNVFNFGKKAAAANNNISMTLNADSDYNANHTATSSKFFGIIKRNSQNTNTINNRTRSGSLGSSIWSNNNPNNNGTQTGEFRVGSWSNNNYGGFMTPQQNDAREYRSPSESLIPISLPQIDIKNLNYENDDLFLSLSHITSDLDGQHSNENSLGESALEKKSKQESGGSPIAFKKRMFSLSSSPSKLENDHSDDNHHGNNHGPSKSSKFFSKISRRNSTVTTSSDSKVSQNSQETTGNGLNTSDASISSGSAVSGTNSSKFSRRLGFLKKDRGKEATNKAKIKKKQKEIGKDKDNDLIESTIDEVSDESEKNSPAPE
ncbi:hypothetical protein LJB42_002772 [Komagataella kurtzmanii]|nr:hypothetical protein LJB42_002772 [Komagataella kurtzmanii]